MALDSAHIRPLFGRFPATARAWKQLAELPTPIERLARLGASIGVPQLWIKRDDQTSKLYGGNKVRKLEFLLGEALNRHARGLVTVGAAGSHHVLATARFGGALGMATTAVVTPQAPSAHATANMELGRRLGVAYVPCRHAALVPAYVGWALTHQPGAYFIPPGGSSTLGALGYVNAGLELAAQVRTGEMPEPAAIVLATGSAGSQAGLVVGLALAGLDVPVIGVRVVPRGLMNEAMVSGLAIATAWRLGMRVGPSWARRRIRLLHDQMGAGYGIETPAATRMIAAMRECEGVSLEGTYTAKALAGALAVGRELGPDRPVLFWHTYAGDQVLLET
jgi:D-cysteine desulfhydrase